MPIINIEQNSIQSKHNIKADNLITSRDVEKLDMVKRNATVSVSMNSYNINISFAAKALRAGKLGDIIMVEKRDKKRLKVVVIGINRVEIR